MQLTATSIEFSIIKLKQICNEAIISFYTTQKRETNKHKFQFEAKEIQYHNSYLRFTPN